VITIHNLEVRMEVEGEGDEAVFARLFDKYIRHWVRLSEEAGRRAQIAEASRALGDRQSLEGE
jgi:hypothetical protein